MENISLKHLFNEATELTKSRTIQDIYKANISYHKYLQLGGRRTLKIDLVKSITKPLDLLSAYKRQKFNSKTRYPTYDDIVRYIVYAFWRIAERGGLRMSKPSTVIHRNNDEDKNLVDISYTVIVSDKSKERQVSSYIEVNESNEVNIDVLIANMLYEIHVLFGGTIETFKLLSSCMQELGYEFIRIQI